MIAVPDQVLSALTAAFGIPNDKLSFLGGGREGSDGIVYSFNQDHMQRGCFGFIHNDPHLQNILKSDQQLVLIDITDPFFRSLIMIAQSKLEWAISCKICSFNTGLAPH